MILQVSCQIIFLFACRVVSIWANRKFFELDFRDDSAAHYLLFKWMKISWGTKYIDQLLIPNKLSYPTTFHKYASLFSSAVVLRKSYIPNLVLYGLAICMYVVFINHIQIVYYPQFPTVLSWIPVLLFAIVPANLSFEKNNILYLGFSERLMARVFAGMHFLGLFFFMQFGDMFSLILTIGSGTYSLLCSKFSRQIILFSSPLISLLSFSLYPVLVHAAAFICALIIGGKYFMRSFIHGFRYSKIYRLFVKHSFSTSRVLSYWVSISKVLNLARSGRVGDLSEHLQTKEPTRTLLFMPEIVLVLFVIADDLETGSIFISLLLLYFITSTRRFNHFGEAYRYLEYGLYFLLPVYISIYLMKMDTSKAGTIIVLIGLAGIYHFFRSASRNNAKSWRYDLKEFLEKYPLSSEHRVFPISARLGVELCAYTECKAVYQQLGGITDVAMWKKYYEQYPYLNSDLAEILEQHRINRIIARKADLVDIPVSYSLSRFLIDYEDENFIVYQLK